MEGSSVLLKNMKGHRNYNFLLPIKAKYVVDKSKAQTQRKFWQIEKKKKGCQPHTRTAKQKYTVLHEKC